MPPPRNSRKNSSAARFRAQRRHFIAKGAAAAATVLGAAACGRPPGTADAYGSGGFTGEEVIDRALILENIVCAETASDILGPKYRAGAPQRLGMLASTTQPGDRLFLSGTVVAPGCSTPAGGAALDVWQADADGVYDDNGFNLRGHFTADVNGRFEIETVLPGSYAGRPRHIHFVVSAGGVVLTTQLYFAGDPFLAPNDPCGSCNSEEPSIIVGLDPHSSGQAGVFDVILA